MIELKEPVKTLNEFLERIKDLRRGWPSKNKPTRQGEQENLWFRGQPSAKWGLSPKLYRKEYRGSQEAEIRQDFQSRALQLMQGRTPHQDDKWEWYFLMQHYGVPTRLLDWANKLIRELAETLARTDSTPPPEFITSLPLAEGQTPDGALAEWYALTVAATTYALWASLGSKEKVFPILDVYQPVFVRSLSPGCKEHIPVLLS